MVRRVAKSLSENELDKVLERIPLKEQRDKWATIAGESFTEAQLADSKRKLCVSTPLACAWLDAMNARPAGRAALAMPNKVPEVLRTFGG